MRFLAVVMLVFCLNKPIDNDLFGPPAPSPWFVEHIKLEPFDLPPGVSTALNSEGYIEIKNDSPTILYMAGTSTQMLLTNSDESPIELPPGTGLLNKAVNGQAYEWVRYYDDVKQDYYSAWHLDDHDSIWLYSYGNKICSTNGCIVDLAPLNHFGGDIPENVKIPEPQKVFLPIIYGNEKIEIPITISYSLNTNYRSVMAFNFTPVIIVLIGLLFALSLFGVVSQAHKRSNNVSRVSRESYSEHFPIPAEVIRRDIVAGFLSWLLLSNLIFLLLTFLTSWDGRSEVSVSIIFWLITFIAILALFTQKKVWVCIGIIVAFMINIGLWAAILFLLGFRTPANLFGNLLVFSGFPLPLGLYILLLGFA